MQVAVLNECLHSLIDVNIPTRTVIITNNDKAWMTPLTKALINDRWAAFRLGQWNLYEHLKTKVKHEITRAKLIWANKLKSSPNGLWKLVKATKNPGHHAQFSNLISKSGSTKRLLEDIACNLSAAFATNGDSNKILDDDEWQMTVSDYEVFQFLRRLKPTKSPGADNIPTRIYKLLADHLRKPLANIYNTCFKQRVFPKLWKQGVIIPVPKSNPPSLSNLRYLTLLPVPSKIMEKLVLKKMWPFFSESYDTVQHGLRPGSSTTTALLQLHDDVTTIFDDLSHSALAILSFNMSRAFDCVDHTLIPTIFETSNFPRGFIVWLQNYLSGRSAFIKIDGFYSSEVQINRGVPQGSVLGPPIFCTYISRIRCFHENVT